MHRAFLFGIEIAKGSTVIGRRSRATRHLLLHPVVHQKDALWFGGPVRRNKPRKRRRSGVEKDQSVRIVGLQLRSSSELPTRVKLGAQTRPLSLRYKRCVESIGALSACRTHLNRLVPSKGPSFRVTSERCLWLGASRSRGRRVRKRLYQWARESV